MLTLKIPLFSHGKLGLVKIGAKLLWMYLSGKGFKVEMIF